MVRCAELWISTIVLNDTFIVLVALAALAMPPVSPSIFEVPATLVTRALVAPTLIDCAVTWALLSTAAVTFEVMVLTASAPAPDSRPTATAVTLVLAAEVCWAETATAPELLTMAPAPIAAVVLAVVLVSGAAASPAPAPPLPASASAALSSLWPDATVRLPAVILAPLPIVALVALVAIALESAAPAATRPTETSDEVAFCRVLPEAMTLTAPA